MMNLLRMMNILVSICVKQTARHWYVLYLVRCFMDDVTSV